MIEWWLLGGLGMEMIWPIVMVFFIHAGAVVVLSILAVSIRARKKSKEDVKKTLESEKKKIKEKFGKKNYILLYFLWGTIVSPLWEELLFRGPIYFAIYFIIEPSVIWLVIIVLGVLFGIAHYYTEKEYQLDKVNRIISSIIFGILLGWLTIETKSLLAPIILHIANNFCEFLVLTTITFSQKTPKNLKD